MDDRDFVNLARDYGLDISDSEDDYVHSHSKDIEPAQDYYADFENLNDDEGDHHHSGDAHASYSSPCPPGRSASHHAGAQYFPNRHFERTSADLYHNRDDMRRNLRAQELYHNPDSPHRSDDRNYPFYHSIQQEPTFRSTSEASLSAAPSGATNRIYSAPYPMPNQTSWSRMQVERGPEAHKEEENGSHPRNAHGIRLRPTSDLPDMYRSLFKFGVFNAVQSKCFDVVMTSDENMVVSAPTGSGKTVLFELAIIRMLIQSGSAGRSSKCIYVAPTKALCSEKYREWTTKFQPLGIKCCELTGDTVQFGKSAWGDARDATVIVTTGEKWDSLTRNWEEHEQILAQIQLFLVDEVHILNESRGSTLEVVIARMKARGSSLRFILVSATVPNIRDVAAWIGNGPSGALATVMEFGEDYRPCKLTRYVYGIPRKKDQNDFMFSRVLDYRLYAILKEHSVDKPVLIFCSTRKSVVTTAEQLLKEYEDATQKKQALPWSRPRRIECNFHDKKLDKLATCGIGVHHAGMSLDDRRTTEELFLNKLLRVIVATSTLAVGVNIPAHTVVIKGVKIFQNNMSQEYSDLDIMQMLGRAGRPQFDKEGIAIILCELELEQKYRDMAQGRTVLESCLHHTLAEHLNSEIGLRTITSVDSAKRWLHSSFLFQRIQQNPRHYAIGKDSKQSWQERLDEMVTESVKKLQENQLVEISGERDESLSSTEYGDIMSKYYIKQDTMTAILNLPERATLKELLEVLSSADEFSTIKIRNGEKQIYTKLRNHDDIRFKLKKVEKPCDKIMLIIQAVLGGISLNDPEYKNGDNQPSLEALTIFRHVSRIARVIVEIAIARKSGAQVKHGMELIRCLAAKAWEDRPLVLRQIEHIGEKSIKVLAQHGINSFDALLRQDSMRIEVLLNRRPPFGHQVLAYVKQLPRYWVKITESGMTASDGKTPVEIELTVECGLLEDGNDSAKSKGSKTRYRDTTLILTTTSDLDFLDFRRISTKALRTSKTFTVTAHLTKPSQTVLVQITSENIAGIAVNKTYKPNVAHKLYPVMDTRPMTSTEIDMAGLADDPDFWNFVPSDEEAPVIDLTKGISPKQKATQLSMNTKDDQHSRSDDSPSGKMMPIPRRLSNGNFACAHTCKDKTSCKHLCCREGTEKPPQWSKKRVETLYPVSGSNSQTKGNDVPKPKKTKAKLKDQDKPDNCLKQLEALHENTNVNASISLKEGRRIKIDDPRCSTHAPRDHLPKGKAAPRFDLEFASLNEGDSAISLLDTGSPELSDDDLPDTHEILAAFNAKKVLLSSKKKYPDVASDDMSCSSPGNSDVRQRDGLPICQETSASMSPYPKRRRAEDNFKTPAKHPRMSGRPQNISSGVSSPPSAQETIAIVARSPLFLEDHSEDANVNMSAVLCNTASPTSSKPWFEEEFDMDETLFDIRSSTLASASVVLQDSPAMTKPESSDRGQLPSSGDKTVVGKHASNQLDDLTVKSQPPRSKHVSLEETDPHDDYDERLDELFAWIESNVVVVDQMDTE